jgi:hypothetical protein
MKLRAIALTIAIGLIILSGLILIKEPAHGRDNLNLFCALIRQSSPLLLLASGILICFTAIKLRKLSILGVALIISSMLISYFISARTGYSMGTPGWSSTFISIFVIIPLGLLLCIVSAFVSLAHIWEIDNSIRAPVLTSIGAIFLVGFGYYFAADRKPDIHGLIQALKNEKLATERFSTAVKLSEITDDKKIPLLLDLLKDNNPRVREAAAVALGGRPQKAKAQALAPLLKAMESEPDLQTKEWMIRTIGAIAPLAAQADRDKAVDRLIEILQGGNPSLKGAAAESLGWIKDGRAIPPLIEALADEPFQAHNALITITGKRLERNPDVWRKWFKETKHYRSKSE